MCCFDGWSINLNLHESPCSQADQPEELVGYYRKDTCQKWQFGRQKIDSTQWCINSSIRKQPLFRPINCFSWRGAVGECQALCQLDASCRWCSSSNTMKVRHLSSTSVFLLQPDWIRFISLKKNSQSLTISPFVDSLFSNDHFPKHPYFQWKKSQGNTSLGVLESELLHFQSWVPWLDDWDQLSLERCDSSVVSFFQKHPFSAPLGQQGLHLVPGNGRNTIIFFNNLCEMFNQV